MCIESLKCVYVSVKISHSVSKIHTMYEWTFGVKSCVYTKTWKMTEEQASEK